MATTDLTIRPFEVHVPDEDLADLRRRVAATRWPGKELVADRSQGVQLATIQALVAYWDTGYVPPAPPSAFVTDHGLGSFIHVVATSALLDHHARLPVGASCSSSAR